MLGAKSAQDPSLPHGGVKASNTAAQNAAALAACISQNRNVHIGYGSFQMDAGVLAMAVQGQTLFGEGSTGQTNIIINGAGNFITTNGKHNCGFERLNFLSNSGNPHTGGAVLLFDGTPAYGGGTGQQLGGYVRDIRMGGVWSAIDCIDTNNLRIDSSVFQSLEGDHGIRGRGNNANQRVDIIDIDKVTMSFSAAAKAAGRGIGLDIDGYVHSVTSKTLRIIGPTRGVQVANSPGLPLGQHAAFIFLDGLEVDFPRREAVWASHCDRLRLVNSYMHGSAEEAGVVIGTGVRDAKVAISNVSGHAKGGIYSDSDILDMTATELDFNGHIAPNNHHGILLGNTAQFVRVVGGGQTDTSCHTGIYRSNPATLVELAAADQHYGMTASRNF